MLTAYPSVIRTQNIGIRGTEPRIGNASKSNKLVYKLPSWKPELIRNKIKNSIRKNEEMNTLENKTEWNETKIEVQASLVPKYIWTTASIDVILEGRFILRTGGKLKVTGVVKNGFEFNGKKYQAVLTWGRSSLWYFPYQLTINENMVSNSKVYIRNWPMVFTVWVILGAVAAIIQRSF
jgi:hypothetical protein